MVRRRSRSGACCSGPCLIRDWCARVGACLSLSYLRIWILVLVRGVSQLMQTIVKSCEYCHNFLNSVDWKDQGKL